MRRIPLTKGQYALVDDADFEWLSQWKWRAIPRAHGGFYAARARRNSRVFKNIYMHRQVLGIENESRSVQADHINRNPLDNRRVNLRIATERQNHGNVAPRANHSSGYKGVGWHGASNKWRAYIVNDGRHIQLGVFVSEEAAARAYDAVATEYFGEFAHLNFPL